MVCVTIICIVTKGCAGHRKAYLYNTVKFLINTCITVQSENTAFMTIGYDK